MNTTNERYVEEQISNNPTHFAHIENNNMSQELWGSDTSHPANMKQPINSPGTLHLKHPESVRTLTKYENTCQECQCLPVPEPDQEIVSCLNHSYESWNSLGLTAYSALCIGSALLSVMSINAVVSLLSCNSVFSILSLNSAFSVFSTNSAFAIGCVDKRFQVCWK